MFRSIETRLSDEVFPVKMNRVYPDIAELLDGDEDTPVTYIYTALQGSAQLKVSCYVVDDQVSVSGIGTFMPTVANGGLSNTLYSDTGFEQTGQSRVDITVRHDVHQRVALVEGVIYSVVSRVFGELDGQFKSLLDGF